MKSKHEMEMEIPPLTYFTSFLCLASTEREFFWEKFIRSLDEFASRHCISLGETICQLGAALLSNESFGGLLRRFLPSVQISFKASCKDLRREFLWILMRFCKSSGRLLLMNILSVSESLKKSRKKFCGKFEQIFHFRSHFETETLELSQRFISIVLMKHFLCF